MLNQITGAVWRIYALMTYVNFDLDNGLSPEQYQAVFLNQCRVIMNWIPGKKLQILVKIHVYIEEKAFENDAYEMSAILSGRWSLNTLWYV